jgi:hypothetical protein
MTMRKQPVIESKAWGYKAEWIPEESQYDCAALGVFSDDGNSWVDRNGRLAAGAQFDNSAIVLIGGPAHGEIVQ